MAVPSSPPTVRDRAAAPTSPRTTGTATRARYITLTYVVVLAVITYIDRIAISQAAPSMQGELGLTAVQMGWVFSIFGWAYAVFEIPGGWLGDRLGSRRVLMRIVLWWSFFTAATGWVWSFSSLLVTRALFGAGEAGAFPNMTRVLTTWMPVNERERSQATLWLATRWGGALTPLLVAVLLQYISWRRAFEFFGVLGVIWAVFFWRWYRDAPSRHPGVNQAELALLPAESDTATIEGGRTPWGRIFSTPAVWLLCLQYGCLAYGWWFYVTWLPTYLRDARGTSVTFGALLAGLPLLMGGIGCLISAAVIPRLSRVLGSVALSRRIVAITGFVGASASIMVFTRIEDPTVGMIVLGFAGLFNDFIMPAAWAGTMDVGGRFAGTVSGAMNTFGSVAGALSPLVVGYLLAATNNDWTITFYVSAAIYSVGAVCWLFLDAHTPVDPGVPEPEAL